MKSGPQLEEGRHALADVYGSRVGLEDAGHAFQERRLTRTVLADDAEDLAFLDVEGDVAERGELVEAVALLAGDQRLQRVRLLGMEPERFRDVPNLKGNVVHGYISSAKRGDMRLNNHDPRKNVPKPSSSNCARRRLLGMR